MGKRKRGILMKYFVVEDPYEASYLSIIKAETLMDATKRYDKSTWPLRHAMPEEVDDSKLLIILFNRLLTNEDAIKVFKMFPEFKEKLDTAILKGRL